MPSRLHKSQVVLGHKIGVHGFHAFTIYLLNYIHVHALYAWVWQCLGRPAGGVRSGVEVTGCWSSWWLGQCCFNNQSIFSRLRITGVYFLFICMCVVSWSELSCALAEFCIGSLALVIGGRQTSSGQPAEPLKPLPLSVFLPSALSHWSMTPRGEAGTISGG